MTLRYKRVYFVGVMSRLDKLDNYRNIMRACYLIAGGAGGASQGVAPAQVGRMTSPGRPPGASTGIDARRGGLDVSEAREGRSMAEEVGWFVGIDWTSRPPAR